MDIKITKAGPWRVWGNLKSFKEGQVLTVGEDVPVNIAEDMLRCEYAEKVNEFPKIETKEEAPSLSDPKPIGPDNETFSEHETVPQKKNLKKKKKKHRS